MQDALSLIHVSYCEPDTPPKEGCKVSFRVLSCRYLSEVSQFKKLRWHVFGDEWCIDALAHRYPPHLRRGVNPSHFGDGNSTTLLMETVRQLGHFDPERSV